MLRKVKVALAGCGNWGKNHASTLSKMANDADLSIICDPVEQNLQNNLPKGYVGRTTCDFQDILGSDAEAVVIATPVPTHFELAKAAIEAGKSVLVEKPLCMRSSEAEELCKLAEEKGVVLFTGHLLYYHPALLELKSRIDSGEFGRIYFARSERLNAGIVRISENAWESLAPHDLSLMYWLFGSELESMTVSGGAYLQPSIADEANASLRFKSGAVGHISVSWLDPVKTRRFTVVGEKKMAVFNDVPGEGLEIYDLCAVKSGTQYKIQNLGSARVEVANESPLQNELTHFFECVRTGSKPVSDGKNGLIVTQWLEKGNQLLKGV